MGATTDGTNAATDEATTGREWVQRLAARREAERPPDERTRQLRAAWQARIDEMLARRAAREEATG